MIEITATFEAFSDLNFDEGGNCEKNNMKCCVLNLFIENL